jgi:hypothetical protein
MTAAGENKEAPRAKTLSRSSVLPDAVGPVTMMTLVADEPILHLLAENLLGGKRHHFAVALFHLGGLEHRELECPPVDGDSQFIGIRIVIDEFLERNYHSLLL